MRTTSPALERPWALSNSTAWRTRTGRGRAPGGRPDYESGLWPDRQSLGLGTYAGWLERWSSRRAGHGNDAARRRLGPRRVDSGAGALLRGVWPQADGAPRSAHRLLSSSASGAALGPHHVLPRPDGARPSRSGARVVSHRRPGWARQRRPAGALG